MRIYLIGSCCLVSMVLGSCAQQVPPCDSAYWVKQYYAIRLRSPLVAEAWYPWLDRSPRGTLLRRDGFAEYVQYGRFVVMEAPWGALVSYRGQAVWAGDSVVPVRSEGRTRLLLCRRLPWEWGDRYGGFQEMIWCRDTFATTLGEGVDGGGSAYMGSGNPGDWVVDIDGDGSDEILTIDWTGGVGGPYCLMLECFHGDEIDSHRLVVFPNGWKNYGEVLIVPDKSAHSVNVFVGGKVHLGSITRDPLTKEWRFKEITALPSEAPAAPIGKGKEDDRNDANRSGARPDGTSKPSVR